MHTKQESEGELDMNGIFAWAKTSTMGEEFPLKATIPSVIEGMPERHGTLWFKSKALLEIEYEDVRSRFSCNTEGWEDLFVRPISFSDEGASTVASNMPILNVCTEFMGEKVFIWYDRKTTMTVTQDEETTELNIVPFSTRPDDCENHDGLLGLDSNLDWKFYPIGEGVDYDYTRKGTTD